jgi:ABC-type Mn2+/Zn2+ transport system ATPase subunit
MPSLPEPAVSVRGVTVRYGARVALCEVTFSVEAGRLLAIVGANGAGKSTLFRPAEPAIKRPCG